MSLLSHLPLMGLTHANKTLINKRIQRGSGEGRSGLKMSRWLLKNEVNKTDTDRVEIKVFITALSKSGQAEGVPCWPCNTEVP